MRMTEYDFNLADPGFLFYAEQRGVLHCMGAPDSRRREFIGDTRLGFDNLKADPYFQFAQEWPPGSGQRHRYTDAELETLWRVIRYDRGRLQDAWELYRQDTETMKQWVRPVQHRPADEPLPDRTPADVCERIEAVEQTAEPKRPPLKTKARKAPDNQIDLFGDWAA